MEKKEIIARYGKAEYKRRVKKTREWALSNPEKKKESDQQANRKIGKRYFKTLAYYKTELRGQRHRIRSNHGYLYRSFKQIIAPESAIHHEWVPESAEYRGVALVEKDTHQYGIVDVIKILDGKITLLTEEEIENTELLRGNKK